MSSSRDGKLLIDDPIALCERVFGPERRTQGSWLAQGFAVRYLVDVEEDDGALEDCGELCSYEE